ncbi:MAG: radical SAM protein [Sumerlaeia bacterium]
MILGLVDKSESPDAAKARQEAIFRSLKVLTMFVTNTCNAKCETCFYWMHLNDPDVGNLQLPDLEKLSKTMPQFPHLLVSGGEPVMRKDLAEVVGVFARNNGLESLDMPTNGLLTKKVVETIEQVLDEHPHLMVTVGHSLDGFKETHDRLRGVKGNFEKLFQTMEALSEMRARRVEKAKLGQGPYPKLRLLTLTCINNQNIQEIEELADWVSSTKDVDGMMFEALRGTPKDPELLPPTTEQFDLMIRKSMEVNDLLMRRRFPEQRTARLAYIRGVYRMQRDHITKGKIPSTCQAGVNLAVLEPDGRVRLCELLDEVGDLRQHDLDWRSVWLSPKAEAQRRWIRDQRCSCTHCVNLGHSIDASAKTRLQRKVDQWAFS